jgi:hypothetical protein
VKQRCPITLGLKNSSSKVNLRQEEVLMPLFSRMCLVGCLAELDFLLASYRIPIWNMHSNIVLLTVAEYQSASSNPIGLCLFPGDEFMILLNAVVFM